VQQTISFCSPLIVGCALPKRMSMSTGHQTRRAAGVRIRGDLSSLAEYKTCYFAPPRSA
jgi:hypothetical protein